VLDAERRIRASWLPCPELLEERRFPFFDRDLREFAHAIPREQLVGIGKRRFLLRRALAGIVPDQILNRKQGTLLRSHTQSPAPQVKSNEPAANWPSPAEMGHHLLSSSIGIVDENQFFKTLEKLKGNEATPVGDPYRTLTLESWLRHLALHGVLAVSSSARRSVAYMGHSQQPRNSVLIKEPRMAATARSKSSAS